MLVPPVYPGQRLDGTWRRGRNAHPRSWDLRTFNDSVSIEFRASCSISASTRSRRSLAEVSNPWWRAFDLPASPQFGLKIRPLSVVSVAIRVDLLRNQGDTYYAVRQLDRAAGGLRVAGAGRAPEPLHDTLSAASLCPSESDLRAESSKVRMRRSQRLCCFENGR